VASNIQTTDQPFPASLGRTAQLPSLASACLSVGLWIPTCCNDLLISSLLPLLTLQSMGVHNLFKLQYFAFWLEAYTRYFQGTAVPQAAYFLSLLCSGSSRIPRQTA